MKHITSIHQDQLAVPVPYPCSYVGMLLAGCSTPLPSSTLLHESRPSLTRRSSNIYRPKNFVGPRTSCASSPIKSMSFLPERELLSHPRRAGKIAFSCQST